MELFDLLVILKPTNSKA